MASEKYRVINLIYRIQDINESDIQTSNFDDIAESFDDMGLKPELLRGIFGYG